MSNRLKPGTLVILAGIFLLLAGIFVTPLFFSDMIPPIQWHIQGRVFDRSTNALTGVQIQVSGTVRVTGANHTFATSPKRFDMQTTSDSSGSFQIDCRAAFFRVAFSKKGFVSEERSFNVPEPTLETNMVLQVFMEANR